MSATLIGLIALGVINLAQAYIESRKANLSRKDMLLKFARQGFNVVEGMKAAGVIQKSQAASKYIEWILQAMASAGLGKPKKDEMDFLNMQAESYAMESKNHIAFRGAPK